MSPASGDCSACRRGVRGRGRVSIQLMSPASGDMVVDLAPEKVCLVSFHSIDVPSEWGQDGAFRLGPATDLQVSIQLMSPASGDVEERGGMPVLGKHVSIQLMSPASGDPTPIRAPSRLDYKSCLRQVGKVTRAAGEFSVAKGPEPLPEAKSRGSTSLLALGGFWLPVADPLMLIANAEVLLLAYNMKYISLVSPHIRG